MIEEARTKTRNLSRSLYPVELELKGFSVVINNLAEQTEKLYDLVCSVSADQNFSINDISIGESLYHIAQEAITNALRHGKPSRIDVELKEEQDQLIIAVEDNGCGLPDDFRESEGMGLRIMRYRARVINGQLEVNHKPGGGTIVKCLVSGVQTLPHTEDSK